MIKIKRVIRNSQGNYKAQLSNGFIAYCENLTQVHLVVR